MVSRDNPIVGSVGGLGPRFSSSGEEQGWKADGAATLGYRQRPANPALGVGALRKGEQAGIRGWGALDSGCWGKAGGGAAYRILVRRESSILLPSGFICTFGWPRTG